MHRLVVADDHPIVSAALRSALPPRAFRVVAECTDGVAALEAVRRHRPNVLVLDLHLPRMDGIAVVERLRAERLPVGVLVLSCEEEDFGGPRALRAGADGYANKGASPAELATAIATVARGKRWFRAAMPACDDNDALLGALSDREFDVLKALAAGGTNGEIAADLALTPKIVSACRGALMRKLGLSNLRGLIEFARANRVLPAAHPVGSVAA